MVSKLGGFGFMGMKVGPEWKIARSGGWVFD